MEKIYRAGLVPYIVNDDGTIVYCFQIVSNPHYGGPDPQISKGKIEEGEDAAYAAIREAEEELGLRQENMKLETLTCLGVRLGRTTFYHVEVFNQTDFDDFCDETSAIRWMTLEEFRHTGRDLHVPVVEEMEAEIQTISSYY